MFSLLPNWHPVAVHFAVALLLVAVALSLLARVRSLTENPSVMHLVGRWNLWLGTAGAAWAVVTGWLAYNSVAHDELAHQAMTVHLRWALVTGVLFLGLSVWAWRKRNREEMGVVWMILMVIGSLALLRTAYLGGENVYRYGLGVRSTPAMRLALDSGDQPTHQHLEAGHGAQHAMAVAEDTPQPTVDEEGSPGMDEDVIDEHSSDGHSHAKTDN